MARQRRKNTKLQISTTPSVVSSSTSSALHSRSPSPAPPVIPFRFFDLPSELRLRIYELLLLVQEPIDLDPSNSRIIVPRMALFLVCHRMHEEAYRVFYSQMFRLYPTHYRFVHYQHALLARLPKRYRMMIPTLELRLGPGFGDPPGCRHTRPSLGLADCTNLRTLKIFVQIDPSDDYLNGFRGKNATQDTFQKLCVNLLRGILQQVPSLEVVELDAWVPITKLSPIVIALRKEIESAEKRLIWGPHRGWDDEDDPGVFAELETAVTALNLVDASAVVAVQA